MQLSKPEIVSIALFQLGGTTQAIGTEEIAIEADRIAPGVFVWRNHPERIDKDLVRIALVDARLKHELVEGSHDKGGWILTPTGVAFAQSADVDKVAGSGSKVGDAELNRERSRLASSDAFVSFSGGGEAAVSDEQADSFFRLSPYMRGEARERKILRIQNLFGDDEDLGEAVTAIADIARREN